MVLMEICINKSLPLLSLSIFHQFSGGTTIPQCKAASSNHDQSHHHFLRAPHMPQLVSSRQLTQHSCPRVLTGSNPGPLSSYRRRAAVIFVSAVRIGHVITIWRPAVMVRATLAETAAGRRALFVPALQRGWGCMLGDDYCCGLDLFAATRVN